MGFEFEVLIREHHLDSYGHVNNATYLALYEEADSHNVVLRFKSPKADSA